MSLSELGVSPASVGAVVKSWEHWCVVATLLLVLYLIWVVVYNNKPVNVPLFGFNRQGMVDYTSSNLGFDSLTDSGNMINTNGPSNGYPLRSKSGFSVGGYEPPVYWPSADYEMLDPYNGSVVQESAVDTEMTAAEEAAALASLNARKAKTGLQGMQDFAKTRRQGFLGANSSQLYAANKGYTL